MLVCGDVVVVCGEDDFISSSGETAYGEEDVRNLWCSDGIGV